MNVKKFKNATKYIKYNALQGEFMTRLKDISIGYKIHLPIIVTIFIGLSVVIFNAYTDLLGIDKKARADILTQMKVYTNQGLNEKKQIGLTNAINLSLNESLHQALKNGNREKTHGYLDQLSKKFKENTDYKNIKIHLHDKDVKSFVRAWKFSAYGDELSSFRDSLNYVKKNHKPISVLEAGRAGMLIRGVAPIIEGNNYLGSVEFIQGFNSVVLNAKKNMDFSLLFFTYTSDRFKRFDEKTPMIGNMVLSQKMSNTNKKLFSALKDMDSKKIYKKEFFIRAGYFIMAIPLLDIFGNEIGSVLVAFPQKKVNAMLDKAEASILSQIWIMISVDIIILLLLLITLQFSIKRPIDELKEAMQSIRNSLLDEQDIMQLNRLKIKMDGKDEIGSIARMINRLLKTLMREFVKVQKASRTTREYAKAVNAGSIVSKSNADGIITYVNQALCDVTGYTEKELIGQPHSILRHPNTPKQTFRILWQTIQDGKIWHGLLKNKRKDGTTFYANITIVPIKAGKNRILEYVALRDDVTELVNSKEELKKNFLTDPLTSLGNRFKLIDTLQQHPKSSMAIIDIHYFKEVNDFYGHEIGDKVIMKLGDNIFTFFNDEGMEVFHLGGDEFAVVSYNTAFSEKSFISKVHEFIDAANCSECIVDEHNISIRLTCGISGISDHLINHADVAHKNAKKLNKDIVIYSAEISTNVEYKKNLEWTKKIKNAIEDNRIKTFYQPIYSNKTQSIEKYETLMRLIEEDGKEVSPFFFLDIAKKTRHYKSLTRIVVEQAFQQFEKSHLEFSVNLSAEDIIMHNIGKYFFDLAQKYGVSNRVVIELVESEGIESFDTVETFISQAKENGMKIAIDDFGTGYSNFEYLIRLSTDYIKIDGSLIKMIDTDKNMRSVVETIVMFAQQNNIKTIAEFVATKEIQDVVEEIGIDYSQGYYHGKPTLL